MLYFILLVTSACGVTWLSLYLFLSGFGKNKTLRDYPHKEHIKRIVEKSGISIETIKLSASPKPFAQLIGLPNNPIMIISQKLEDTFTNDKLEYVVQHETAHYVYNHTLKEVTVFLFSYLFCVLLFTVVENSFTWLITIPILALTITVTNIQIARLFERQADMFAASHISNPHAMISATHKFMKYYGDRPPEKSLRRRLFYRGTPYSERIIIAENELKKRR